MSPSAQSQQAKAEPQQHGPQLVQQSVGEQTTGLLDQRTQFVGQRRLQALADNIPQSSQLQARSAMMHNSARAAQLRSMQAMINGTSEQKAEDETILQGKLESSHVRSEASTQLVQQSPPVHKPNNTGLPNQLKAGIESLSGMSLEHVRVNYNSEKPAQLNAHAYAQGSEIHVASGQEQHLPHEAWHVVQQAQGRVKPTMQMNAAVPVNDDERLEEEADVMGAKALGIAQRASYEPPGAAMSTLASYPGIAHPTVQRQLRQSKNAGGDLEKIAAADLGVDGLMLKYASRMSEDTAALVDGARNTKKAGVITALKAGTLDEDRFSNDVVKIILESREWANAGDDEIIAFAKFFRNELGEDEVEDEAAADAREYLADQVFSEREISEMWVAQRLDVAQAANSGDALTAGASIPDAWKNIFIDQLYEATKSTWYAVDFIPYTPPFKKLIQDINAGRIDGFTYVEKYGAATRTWGAEFAVSAPDEKRDFYDNRAVLHTHYVSGTSGPNYAHTKPYPQRKEGGFGYTTVNTGRVDGMDDTQKTFNTL